MKKILDALHPRGKPHGFYVPIKMNKAETKLRDIFFEALQPVVSDLKPEDIEVKERLIEPDAFDGMNILANNIAVIESGGTRPDVGVISNDTETNITFVGFKLEFEQAKELHDLLMGLTGVHCSYNDAFMCLHHSCATVSADLNSTWFKTQVAKRLLVEPSV